MMLGYPVVNQVENFDANHQNYCINRLAAQGYAPLDLDPTGKTWLYATSLDGIQGKGKIDSYDNGGVAQYKKAEISLGYEALTYIIKTDAEMINAGYVFPQTIGSPDESFMSRYVTKFRQPTAEYLQLPFGALKWVQQKSVVDPPGLVSVPGGTVGVIQAAQEVTYTWHMVPSVPVGVKTQIGTVNSSPFDFGQYQRGQLLLTNVEVRPYRWFFNQRLFDIVYKFRFFAPAGGGPDSNAAGFPTQDSNDDLVLEYYGNNHFLHYKKIGDVTGSLPNYAMLSNDGRRPQFDHIDLNTGFPVGGTFPNVTQGRTVYTYSDFERLFRVGAPASPPE